MPRVVDFCCGEVISSSRHEKAVIASAPEKMSLVTLAAARTPGSRWLRRVLVMVAAGFVAKKARGHYYESLADNSSDFNNL